MQAIEQRQPTSQKNQVGFDKNANNISNECLIEENPYQKVGGNFASFSSLEKRWKPVSKS